MIAKDAQFKSGRHLYNRGWLGLIPLIGGFVGQDIFKHFLELAYFMGYYLANSIKLEA